MISKYIGVMRNRSEVVVCGFNSSIQKLRVYEILGLSRAKYETALEENQYCTQQTALLR